jgi:hypothetical protein
MQRSVSARKLPMPNTELGSALLTAARHALVRAFGKQPSAAAITRPDYMVQRS